MKASVFNYFLAAALYFSSPLVPLFLYYWWSMLLMGTPDRGNYYEDGPCGSMADMKIWVDLPDWTAAYPVCIIKRGPSPPEEAYSTKSLARIGLAVLINEFLKIEACILSCFWDWFEFRINAFDGSVTLLPDLIINGA